MDRKPAATDECPVKVLAGPVSLPGDLCLPEGAKALVVFAHGSGSSRFSPRNRYVAGALRQAGLGTLLFDLLTPEEEGQEVFNIGLLAQRLVAATDWVKASSEARHLKLGYFGASTGAAAALMAAAERPDAVGAVVSRGGRPDLAEPALSRVKAPTLLIVGSRDFPVITMNEEALAQLRAEKDLVLVPSATHLFEEPGTLEQVARLAADWFTKKLATA